jgi:hypothetical protein
MRRSAHLSKTLLTVLCALFTFSCGFGDRTDVLILVRADDPISASIGSYYASARGVPSHRILELELSAADDPNEIDAATFDSEIAAPIESYLAAQDPEAEISILVTTSGIPLRIGHCKKSQPNYPRDCRSSAVDALLAGLGRLSPVRGLLAENVNPYFGDPRPFERFRRDEPEARLRFLVARITGPSTPLDAQSHLPVALRRLIDQPDTAPREPPDMTPLWQIVAEAPRASRAAASAALFDPIRERLGPRGYRVCDGCKISAEASAPIGVVLQGNPEGQAAAALPDRLAFPGLVISIGGKEGSPFQSFLAIWLARGARAISTHLGDPSLGGVTRPAIQLQAWAQGRSAVEAHFSSVPHLGWVNIFIGDPLLVLAETSRAEDGDLDADGIPDERDNCLDVSNPAQRDSNNDQVGNRCDPDVDNDGRVDTSWGKIYPLDARGDLEAIALTARNGPYHPDHDLNGDGEVDEDDLALAQLWLFRSPGPSGYSPEAHGYGYGSND